MRSNDLAEAEQLASQAVDILADISRGARGSAFSACERDVAAAANEAIKEHQLIWEQRSAGAQFPSSDEIDLFFAFYGAAKIWTSILDEAETLCGGDPI